MEQLSILISHTSVYKKSGWGRIFPLAVGLVKQGNNVTILTTNPHYSFLTKEITVENVKIIIYPEIIPSRVSRMGFGLLSLLLKVFHVLFHKYDVVQSDNGHRPLSGLPCRIHKWRFGSVYVAEWWDWYGKGGQYDNKNEFFKFFFGRYELKWEVNDKKVADGVVVLSEVLRLRAEQFKEKNRIVKIHGGADVSLIPFVKDNLNLKKKYNIDKDILTFGYISLRNSNIKEFNPLLKAMSKFDVSSKIKILVFGDSSKLIDQIPIVHQDKFVFFGWIDYSTDFEKLQCVDVFFLFKEETLMTKAGWPNCLGDYLACGRPVLIHAVGETEEFVKQYPYGFIETSGNEDDVYAKIQQLLINKRGYIGKGDAIRKLAEDVVSWDSKSKELYDFYLSLLKLKKETKQTYLVKKI